MVRFIFFCIAFTVFAVIAVPVYTGVSSMKKELDVRPYQFSENQATDDSLTFDEIYAIAGEDATAEELSQIEPAAGETSASDDDFSGALKESQHPAL